MKNVVGLTRRVALTCAVGISSVLWASAPAMAADEPGYGVAFPPEAKSFEGVWMIDVKASGLPGVGKSPPKLTDWAKDEEKTRQQKRANGDVKFDLTANCSNPGTPRMMSLPSPIQIYARPQAVTILLEWNHLFRQIFVDGKEHEATYSTAAGLSIGKWENGKLVVHTTDRNDKTMLNDSIPNGEDLTIDEVFEVSKDGKTLNYQFTATDPKALAEPWTRKYVFHKQKDRKLVEDTCLDRFDAGKPAVPKGF